MPAKAQLPGQSSVVPSSARPEAGAPPPKSDRAPAVPRRSFPSAADPVERGLVAPASRRRQSVDSRESAASGPNHSAASNSAFEKKNALSSAAFSSESLPWIALHCTSVP